MKKNFTNTNLTTTILDNDEKQTLFSRPNNVGFYDMIHTRSLKSARLKINVKNLPEVIERFRNLLLSLPTIGKIEDFLKMNLIQKVKDWKLLSLET